MKTFHLTLLCLFTAADLAVAANNPPSAPTSSPEKKDVVTLDKLVVSAGPDEKTLFDLAQGTSILTGEDLRRQTQPTLGETLAATPGVNSTYYGPGASRPLIRGLGGDRVRMLANSIGSLDASNISPDHNVALEPLFASSIEVLRGPSTLLYGSSAVGGVVNVIDNRIPSDPGDGRAHGAAELRGWGANDERTGVFAVGGGTPDFAVQLDAMRQKTGDIDIPGVARIDEEAPSDQPRGTVPNTAIDTKDVSLGGTLFRPNGNLGLSVRRYATFYGVPNGEDPPVSIDMHQTRVDLDGAVTQPFGAFRSARVRFGYGDYMHSELDGNEIGTTFKNKAWEGRLELPHVALGPITGTVGLQASRSDFSAVGEEVVTPPSVTSNYAVFALEELKTDDMTLQFGVRHEQQSIRLGEVSPDLPVIPGYDAPSHEHRSLGGNSATMGVVGHPAKDTSLALTLAYSERLPTAQELFSNGPHGGTDAYEVGTGSLGREKSLGVDVSLRRRAGFVTGAVGAFANRFTGYIFEQELPADAIPEESNPDGLTPYQFVARDALFYGGEAEVTLHLLDGESQRLHLEFTSDYVHASNTTDHTPLPRIPALRAGVELRYETGPWQLAFGTRHTFRQNRYTATETATSGYTLVSADVSYAFTRDQMTYEVFARGENFTNVEARVHTSFLKDLAPLPGRGITIGARCIF